MKTSQVTAPLTRISLLGGRMYGKGAGNQSVVVQGLSWPGLVLQLSWLNWVETEQLLSDCWVLRIHHQARGFETLILLSLYILGSLLHGKQDCHDANSNKSPTT